MKLLNYLRRQVYNRKASLATNWLGYSQSHYENEVANHAKRHNDPDNEKGEKDGGQKTCKVPKKEMNQDSHEDHDGITRKTHGPLTGKLVQTFPGALSVNEPTILRTQKTTTKSCAKGGHQEMTNPR